MNVCQVCGSTKVVTFKQRGRTVYRRFCSKHYSQYVYRIQKASKLRKRLKGLV